MEVLTSHLAINVAVIPTHEIATFGPTQHCYIPLDTHNLAGQSVLGPTSSRHDVYNASVKDVVDNVLMIPLHAHDLAG